MHNNTVFLLCGIINRYSDGGPEATPATLPHFKVDYVEGLVIKALPDLEPFGFAMAVQWLKQPTLDAQLAF